MASKQHWARWVLMASASLGLVCGLVLLTVGIWTIHDKSFLEELLRNRLYINTTYVVLVSSSLLILLSGFGWFAAMREIKCFLLTYFVALLLLFVILMVGGVLAYVFREQVQWSMKAEMITEIRNYSPGDTNSPVTRAWDTTQTKLQCCGLLTEQVDSSWEMWRYNRALNPSPPPPSATVLPSSCCQGGQSPCVGLDPLVHTGDCFTLALGDLLQHAATLGAAALAVTALMVPGMVSALIMFRTIV